MLFVKFMPDGSIHEEKLPPGHHYVEIALNEVHLFFDQDGTEILNDFLEHCHYEA